MPKTSGEPAPAPAAEERSTSLARRAGTWLVWWALLMAFWVILDDSIDTDELLAGAGAAALGAFLAELAGHQTGSRPRIRARWLIPALRLPGDVARDTVIVFTALARRLVLGQEPASGFRELPVRPGPDTPDGATRRALLIGGRSLAPNTFVLGIETDRDVMIVHQLVATEGKPAGEKAQEPEPGPEQESAR